MNIGVLFEIIISALSVIGAYSVLLELFKLVFVKNRYVIAVKGDGVDSEILCDRLSLARGLARHSTGAQRCPVVLFEDESKAALADTAADIYVKRK